MSGKVASIDLSLENLWRSWCAYKKGKESSHALDQFRFHLEAELFNLYKDLKDGNYHHGSYRRFIVCDNKRREISVTAMRDRVVHRLLYDYLVAIYDKTFLYDVWSCRKDKGLVAGIERTQQFFRSFPAAYVWRSDIQKFFDSVDHQVLLRILSFRVKDEQALSILREIIASYSSKPMTKVGIPIGNLTSQIFANIYLHELDHFIKHSIKPLRYLRYGDDFILLEKDLHKLKHYKDQITRFLENDLHLKINTKNDVIRKIKQGLKFLGVVIYPGGRKLNRRNEKRISRNLEINNISSYWGLVQKHGNIKGKKLFAWVIDRKLDKLSL